MSYGGNIKYQFRQAAFYVGCILKGASLLTCRWSSRPNFCGTARMLRADKDAQPVDCAPHVSLTFSSSLPTILCYKGLAFHFFRT